jgi:hypothetical protein
MLHQLKCKCCQHELYIVNCDHYIVSFGAKDIMNFTYSTIRGPDGKWGSRNADGSWNGMIKQILDGHVDMRYGAINFYHV